MDFVQGPPTFAVEVRSKGDYEPKAELDMASKRADYLHAGTLVVWDVDTQAECIRKYTADAPQNPTLFLRGQEADAEPAVPGWRIGVDRVFGY
jgi:Uma2 family endonuclease